MSMLKQRSPLGILSRWTSLPPSSIRFHFILLINFYTMVQKEIFRATDVIAKAYKKDTLVEHRNSLSTWRAMTTTEDKARKSIRTKSFKKHVVIANKKNGNAFFEEVPYPLFLTFIGALLYALLNDYLPNQDFLL